MMKFLVIFFYNLFFPIGFIFFIPGMVYKLFFRPGYKKNFLERFAVFSIKKKKILQDYKGCIWIHAVSVGETVVALSFIEHWHKCYPKQKFVLSTTTTTGQEIARSKKPNNVEIIFCPIDFYPFVEITFSIIKPSLLLIFETEIWPNMIFFANTHGVKTALLNGRMSDKSFNGYKKFRILFEPILRQFDLICVQSDEDMRRFAEIYGIDIHNAESKLYENSFPIRITGNMKFDRNIPDNFIQADLEYWFGNKNDLLFILAASTHAGEEKLIAETYLRLYKKFPFIRLILVPRHVERTREIEGELQKLNINFSIKSQEKNTLIKSEHILQCLLVNTTGELLSFIKSADIVIMGKSLAGHTEGHNIIEPALLAKPIVTGKKLSNFKALFSILRNAEAINIVENDNDLGEILEKLIVDKDLRKQLGQRAYDAVSENRGAINNTIKILVKELSS